METLADIRANAVLERDQHVETLWSWGKRPGRRHDNAERISARRESKRRYDVSEKCSTEGEKYLHGYDFLSEEGLEVREATHDGLIFDPSSIHGVNEEQNHRVYESIAASLPLRDYAPRLSETLSSPTPLKWRLPRR